MHNDKKEYPEFASCVVEPCYTEPMEGLSYMVEQHSLRTYELTLGLCTRNSAYYTIFGKYISIYVVSFIWLNSIQCALINLILLLVCA